MKFLPSFPRQVGKQLFRQTSSCLTITGGFRRTILQVMACGDLEDTEIHRIAVREQGRMGVAAGRDGDARNPHRCQTKGYRSRTIVVVTTLLDADTYSAKDVTDLFAQRWHCELDLRSIKRCLGMHHLHCCSPEMVRKELWTHLLAYNLI